MAWQDGKTIGEKGKSESRRESQKKSTEKKFADVLDRIGVKAGEIIVRIEGAATIITSKKGNLVVGTKDALKTLRDLPSNAGFDRTWTALEKTSHKDDVRITMKKVDGEYQVIWWEGHKRDENKTYYTDDKEDALATKALMEETAKQQNRL